MKQVICFLFVVFTCACLFGQNTFRATISGTNSDEGASVIQVSDGGYIVCGSTDSYGPGSNNVYIIKLNAQGQSVWTKVIASAGFDEAISIINTSDNGFAIGGMLNDKMCIIKFDINGNVSWHKTYHEIYASGGGQVLETNDGGFIIAGYSAQDINQEIISAYIVKTDNFGNVQWSNRYFNHSFNGIFDIVNTSDGNFAFAARTADIEGNSDSAFIVKINPSGQVIWSKHFKSENGLNGNVPTSLIQSSDGGLIIGGYVNVHDLTGYVDLFILKLDASGNKIWSKRNRDGLTSASLLFGGVETFDNGYAFVGSFVNSENKAYLYLLKTDQNGNKVFTQGVPQNDFASFLHTIIRTSDGGYIVAGSYETANGNEEATVMKYNGNFDNCANPVSIGDIKDYGVVENKTISAVAANTVENSDVFSLTAGGPVIPDCSALPVELISFNALPDNKGFVKLTWSTSSEMNNVFFVVERSKDGQHFSEIQRVQGKGTTNIASFYAAVDTNPYSGKSYYRLKQVDKDGTFRYSDIAAIELNKNNQIAIYSNGSRTVYVTSNKNTQATVELFNHTGQKLLLKNVQLTANTTISINISSLPSGVYVCKVGTNEGTITQQVLIK